MQNATNTIVSIVVSWVGIDWVYTYRLRSVLLQPILFREFGESADLLIVIVVVHTMRYTLLEEREDELFG
jgi:hypothetical protein